MSLGRTAGYVRPTSSRPGGTWLREARVAPPRLSPRSWWSSGRRGSERSGTADVTGRVSTFLARARRGAAGLLAGRRPAGHAARRKRLLKAIDETELWQRAVLDLLYREALDDEAGSRQIEEFLATGPWPQAHADLLGPDRDAVLALSFRLMNAPGRTEAVTSWTEAQQVVGRRMAAQRKRVQAGREPEEPTNPDPAGPFGA